MIAAALVSLALSLPAGAAELVMVEQPGCTYCAQWNEEVAPGYAKTGEGQFAPLRRVQLRDMPEDIDLTRRVVFTPTFLVVEDGRELARLEGYPGAHFFWPLLSDMLGDTTTFEGGDG